MLLNQIYIIKLVKPVVKEKIMAGTKVKFIGLIEMAGGYFRAKVSTKRGTEEVPLVRIKDNVYKSENPIEPAVLKCLIRNLGEVTVQG